MKKGYINSSTECAVKKIHTLLLKSATDEDINDENIMAYRNYFIQYFIHEASIMSKLDHPNIVRFFGTYYPDEHSDTPPYIVMERCMQSLSNYIRKNSHIPLRERLTILHGVADAQCYLHSLKIVHGDLTPSNILLSKDHKPKLGDFGSAMFLVDGEKLTTQAPGAANYMPPEASGDNCSYDEKVDIYSFGCVIYFTLTGRELKGGEMLRHRILQRLVERCVDSDPHNRPSASKVFAWLCNIIGRLDYHESNDACWFNSIGFEQNLVFIKPVQTGDLKILQTCIAPKLPTKMHKTISLRASKNLKMSYSDETTICDVSIEFPAQKAMPFSPVLYKGLMSQTPGQVVSVPTTKECFDAIIDGCGEFVWHSQYEQHHYDVFKPALTSSIGQPATVSKSPVGIEEQLKAFLHAPTSEVHKTYASVHGADGNESSNTVTLSSNSSIACDKNPIFFLCNTLSPIEFDSCDSSLLCQKYISKVTTLCWYYLLCHSLEAFIQTAGETGVDEILHLKGCNSKTVDNDVCHSSEVHSQFDNDNHHKVEDCRQFEDNLTRDQDTDNIDHQIAQYTGQYENFKPDDYCDNTEDCTEQDEFPSDSLYCSVGEQDKSKTSSSTCHGSIDGIEKDEGVGDDDNVNPQEDITNTQEDITSEHSSSNHYDGDSSHYNDDSNDEGGDGNNSNTYFKFVWSFTTISFILLLFVLLVLLLGVSLYTCGMKVTQFSPPLSNQTMERINGQCPGSVALSRYNISAYQDTSRARALALVRSIPHDEKQSTSKSNVKSFSSYDIRNMDVLLGLTIPVCLGSRNPKRVGMSRSFSDITPLPYHNVPLKGFGLIPKQHILLPFDQEQFYVYNNNIAYSQFNTMIATEIEQARWMKLPESEESQNKAYQLTELPGEQPFTRDDIFNAFYYKEYFTWYINNPFDILIKDTDTVLHFGSTITDNHLTIFLTMCRACIARERNHLLCDNCFLILNYISNSKQKLISLKAVEACGSFTHIFSEVTSFQAPMDTMQTPYLHVMYSLSENSNLWYNDLSYSMSMKLYSKLYFDLSPNHKSSAMEKKHAIKPIASRIPITYHNVFQSRPESKYFKNCFFFQTRNCNGPGEQLHKWTCDCLSSSHVQSNDVKPCVYSVKHKSLLPKNNVSHCEEMINLGCELDILTDKDVTNDTNSALVQESVYNRQYHNQHVSIYLASLQHNCSRADAILGMIKEDSLVDWHDALLLEYPEVPCYFNSDLVLHGTLSLHIIPRHLSLWVKENHGIASYQNKFVILKNTEGQLHFRLSKKYSFILLQQRIYIVNYSEAPLHLNPWYSTDALSKGSNANILIAVNIDNCRINSDMIKVNYIINVHRLNILKKLSRLVMKGSQDIDLLRSNNDKIFNFVIQLLTDTIPLWQGHHLSFDKLDLYKNINSYDAIINSYDDLFVMSVTYRQYQNCFWHHHTIPSGNLICNDKDYHYDCIFIFNECFIDCADLLGYVAVFFVSVIFGILVVTTTTYCCVRNRNVKCTDCIIHIPVHLLANENNPRDHDTLTQSFEHLLLSLLNLNSSSVLINFVRSLSVCEMRLTIVGKQLGSSIVKVRMFSTFSYTSRSDDSQFRRALMTDFNHSLVFIELQSASWNSIVQKSVVLLIKHNWNFHDVVKENYLKLLNHNNQLLVPPMELIPTDLHLPQCLLFFPRLLYQANCETINFCYTVLRLEKLHDHQSIESPAEYEEGDVTSTLLVTGQTCNVHSLFEDALEGDSSFTSLNSTNNAHLTIGGTFDACVMLDYGNNSQLVTGRTYHHNTQQSYEEDNDGHGEDNNGHANIFTQGKIKKALEFVAESHYHNQLPLTSAEVHGGIISLNLEDQLELAVSLNCMHGWYLHVKFSHSLLLKSVMKSI